MTFERVMVTGAAGFIGSHLCEALVAEGRTVIGIDNFAPNYPKAYKMNNLAGLMKHSGFTFAVVDVEGKEVKELLASIRPNVVIHLAATPGVLPSINHVLEYVDNNVRGTASILGNSVAAGVSKIVFASSSSVYGHGFSEASREDDPLIPLSPYAATKVSGEALCRSFESCYSVPITCIRFFTVYGPRQRPDMAIHALARCITTGSPFRIKGDGRSARDYTYISDIVSGICASLEKDDGFAVYNLGSGRPIELQTMVSTVAEALGTQPVLEEDELSSAEPTRTFADIRKAGVELGYKPQVKFEQGIARFSEWFVQMQTSRSL